MPLTLITGGAGFIGGHLAETIAASGERVRVLDNFSSSTPDRIDAISRRFPGLVEITEGDIRVPAVCRAACAGARYVLHHAAMASVTHSISDPAMCAAVNIGGTVALLSASRQSGTVERLVFASSCAIYGDAERGALEESFMPNPLSPYAVTKLAGEQFCRNFSALLDVPTVVLRYFNVYGQYQSPHGAYAAVIPKFAASIAEGRAPVVYGDGKQTRDFVAIEDVVRANLLACRADVRADGSPINIGSGHAVSLNDLLRTLEDITGNPVPAKYEAARAGDIRHSIASVERARIVLGFSSQIGIRDGVGRIVSAVRQSTGAML
jgi:nucleoside-diphosphate-sugar epimerase